MQVNDHQKLAGLGRIYYSHQFSWINEERDFLQFTDSSNLPKFSSAALVVDSH